MVFDPQKKMNILEAGDVVRKEEIECVLQSDDAGTIPVDISGIFTWNGTNQPTATVTTQLAVGGFIHALSDNTKIYKITSIDPGVSVTLEDVNGIGWHDSEVGARKCNSRPTKIKYTSATVEVGTTYEVVPNYANAIPNVKDYMRMNGMIEDTV